jgi:hypothetical protein
LRSKLNLMKSSNNNNGSSNTNGSGGGRRRGSNFGRAGSFSRRQTKLDDTRAKNLEKLREHSLKEKQALKKVEEEEAKAKKEKMKEKEEEVDITGCGESLSQDATSQDATNNKDDDSDEEDEEDEDVFGVFDGEAIAKNEALEEAIHKKVLSPQARSSLLPSPIFNKRVEPVKKKNDDDIHAGKDVVDHLNNELLDEETKEEQKNMEVWLLYTCYFYIYFLYNWYIYIYIFFNASKFIHKDKCSINLSFFFFCCFPSLSRKINIVAKIYMCVCVY